MPRPIRLITSLAACGLLWSASVRAQVPHEGNYRSVASPAVMAEHVAAADTVASWAAGPNPAGAVQSCCDGSGCDRCGAGIGEWTPDRVFYGGIDYLLVRPHFSQAVAFVEGTQTPTSFSTATKDLDFNRDSSVRLFVGLPVGLEGETVQFTYTRLHGETNIDGAAAPGRFAVDPFGNVVGTVAVIDPHSRLFGQPLTGGDTIHTRASVSLNIYDLEFIRPLLSDSCAWDVRWSAGARIADINQYYGSAVSSQALVATAIFPPGVTPPDALPLASGDYRVEFLGAGPRLGLEGRRHFADGEFSLFANSHGSLLLGNYDSRFGNTVFLPATFEASQTESLTRLLPVLETEVGGAWQVTDSIRVSGGYLFQAWFDLGTSGGTFGGFFTGTDDANIMSFDGLFARGEVAF